MSKAEHLSLNASPLERWIRVATMRLGRAGIALARFEAERLAAHGLGVRWADIWTSRNRALDEATTKKLDRLVARRESGEPLAYIEGSRGFYGLELACGPGVLVPRPETELVVDVALELIDGIDKPVVVDLGTGTGAIALAIASVRSDAEIVATDISTDALAYARRNADATKTDVWFACGDLFDAVPQQLRGRIDLVVSNPPYVADGTQLEADVLAEPANALFGGSDGADVLRRIIDEAPRWLRAGGALVCEIGEPTQLELLSNLRTDLNDRPRVIWSRF